MSEAQFIREHLECGIIRQVAASIDRRGLADIRRLLEQQQEACDDADTDRFYDLDEALHATFCRIAGRAGVWRMIHQSKVHMDRVRHLSLQIERPHPTADRPAPRHIRGARSGTIPTTPRPRLRAHLREVFATIDKLQLERHRQRRHREGKTP